MESIKKKERFIYNEIMKAVYRRTFNDLTSDGFCVIMDYLNFYFSIKKQLSIISEQ